MRPPPNPPALTSEVGTIDTGRLEHLRALSRLLDSAVGVPGTRLRVGLDALIGLVPGLGDAVSTALSGYIIVQATRFGAPKAKLARMAANVAIDTVVGAVPALGDLFDIGWKANSRNVALLAEHVERPRTARAASRRCLILLGLGLLLVFVAAVGVAVLVAGLVLEHL